LTGFIIVWQNTPLTVCHRAMACSPRWCCVTVLPDGVIQHNFFQKWCNLACLCAWASEGSFPEGHMWIFPKIFLGGPKWWNLCFATRNKSLYCWNFRIPASLTMPMLVYIVSHH